MTINIISNDRPTPDAVTIITTATTSERRDKKSPKNPAIKFAVEIHPSYIVVLGN